MNQDLLRALVEASRQLQAARDATTDVVLRARLLEVGQDVMRLFVAACPERTLGQELLS